MRYNTLITSKQLNPHIDRSTWAIMDCRFDLYDQTKGEREYTENHIPGAVYAHLERDLSAPPTGSNGRHPLPTPESLSAVFTRWGIGSDVQVVAYDATGGPFASRLWWCLRFLGHEAVAVLDGGYHSWKKAGFLTQDEEENRSPRTFIPLIQTNMRADNATLMSQIGSPSSLLLDARAPERFRGEKEPLDPVAGHIPGAINRFWEYNLDNAGQFLPPEVLRTQFEVLFGETSPQSIISYCGSGVTSCHNLLAMEYAGLHGARLYPGSWSEWCADPTRPVATEDQPPTEYDL